LLESFGRFDCQSIWLNHAWTLKQWLCRGKMP